MKSLLIIASVVALAFASPVQRGLVTPGGAGPAPVPELSPIAVGPAILEFEPIAVGPAIVESSPISVGPAIIDSVPEFEPIAVGPAIVEGIVAPEAINIPTGTPLVQIILNIQGNQAAAPSPAAVAEVPEIVPTPVHVVDYAPVQVVEQAPEAISVGPAIVEEILPEPVVIGNPILPTPIVPEPVVIGSPILPSPAVVLPETLN